MGIFFVTRTKILFFSFFISVYSFKTILIEIMSTFTKYMITHIFRAFINQNLTEIYFDTRHM